MFFIYCDFSVIPKKYFPNTRPQQFFPFSPSFNSHTDVYDLWWANFCIWYEIRACVYLFNFVYGYPILQELLVEKTTIPTLNGLGTLIKSQLIINIRIYIWTLNFCSIDIHACPCSKILHHLHYFGCILSLKSGDASSPVFVFFKDRLLILGPSRFHINFRLYNIKPSGILIGIALNLQINLVGNAILHCWVFQSMKMQCLFLFILSLISFSNTLQFSMCKVYTSFVKSIITIFFFLMLLLCELVFFKFPFRNCC